MTIKRQFKLGDAVAKIAKALDVSHCEKCEQRRLILNKIRTLGIKKTIKKLRAIGFSESEGLNESWTTKEIIKKMEDCCDEK